jgi:hypothetical protein
VKKSRTPGETAPAGDPEGSVIVLTYKGTKKFRDWMEGFADKLGLPVNCVMDLAMRDFAVHHKYDPMPRRYSRRKRD